MTETTATTGTSAGKDGQETAEDSALTETPAEARGEARVEDSGDAPPAEAARPPEVEWRSEAAEAPADEPAEEPPEPRPERAGGLGWSARLARPTYTRAPGMTPPPEEPEQLDDGGPGPRDSTVGVPPSAVLSATAIADAASTGSFPVISPNSGAFPLLSSSTGSFPTVSAAAPVSAPPRQATSGRVATPGGVTVRPIGPGATGPAVGSARVVEVRPRAAATPRGPRRARLNVKRIDPWSVMKFSFAVSLVLFVVVIVAASVLYLALDAMGVFTSINNTVAELVDATGEGTDSFRISARGVIGTAAVLGALNVLLFTSLATLGAFIYNVCADLVGGVEVTLAERD
jgi:hypothetical protein